MIGNIGGGALSSQVLRLLGMSDNRGIANNVAALTSGNRLNSASIDVASLSAATGLQAEITSLRSAGQNIVRAGSLLQVADEGAAQIAGVLERMGELAALSHNDSLSEGGREAMNSEFQALKQEIDSIAGKTSFGGQKLLDGSYKDDMDKDFLISNLNTESILPEDISIIDVESSFEAYNAVKSAYADVIEQRTNISSYQARIDVTAASIETALQNQEAARASLEDTNILSSSTNGITDLIRYQSGIAGIAQGNKLEGNLIELLATGS